MNGDSGRGSKFTAGCITVCLILLAADQLSKWYAVKFLTLGEQHPVISGFFSVTYVRNPGAAWSMFSGHRALLAVFSVCVFTAILIFFRRLSDGFRERILALFLLLAGIAGNTADRIFRGEVVDFLDFTFGSYRYPTFNIADSAICTAVGIMIISSLCRKDSAKKDDKKAVV